MRVTGGGWFDVTETCLDQRAGSSHRRSRAGLQTWAIKRGGVGERPDVE